MTKNNIHKAPNATLILYLVRLYNIETKTAKKEAESIVKELHLRGVILDAEKFLKDYSI